jgi:hypothetical protein
MSSIFANSPQKQKNNDKLLQLFTSCIKEKYHFSAKFLILDCIEFSTLNTILYGINEKINPENIDIFEIDNGNFNKMRWRLQLRCNHTKGGRLRSIGNKKMPKIHRLDVIKKMEELMAAEQQTFYSFIYLDLMKTLPNITSVIKSVIKNNRPESGRFVLGVTFCQRRKMTRKEMNKLRKHLPNKYSLANPKGKQGIYVKDIIKYYCEKYSVEIISLNYRGYNRIKNKSPPMMFISCVLESINNT